MSRSAAITFAQFESLSAKHRHVPVCLSAPCDAFSPVDTFESLSSDCTGFILDGASPEPGASRYAYVGVGEQAALGPGEFKNSNPFDALRDTLATVAPGLGDGLPLFVSGAVGYFGYEAARHIEPVVEPLHRDPTGVPETALIRPTEMIAFDREERSITAVVVVDTTADSLHTLYAQAIERCRELLALAAAASRVHTGTAHESNQRDGLLRGAEARELVARAEYERRVDAARQAIIDGELIQVVLSQRLERRTGARPLDVYRELTRLNPSTYMFYLGFGATRSCPGGFHVIGASPELMTRVRDGVASVHPIAGTRPRSPDAHRDAAIERELISNEKERAEHIMLVDLARNDLGRVCRPGTVEVPYLMRTERYSHVMHLVSRVRGVLREGCDGIAAFEAGFPIGTLAGAPKIRAMQLISELESEGRGPYCGGVGWFGANGDLDTGTVIRSVVFRDGIAHIQGGGGIVFDSDPSAEYEESLNKTTAQLEAIAAAESRSESPGDRWRSPVTVNA